MFSLKVGKSEDSVATTEMSDLSIDIPKEENPFVKMMNFCSPKSTKDEDEDAYGFGDYGSNGMNSPVETEEAVGAPVLFDTGLSFQIVAIGAILIYETMA